MLHYDLYFKILSLLYPSSNYFLVSKLFNNMCNQIYFEDKRYSTEKVLIRFEIDDLAGDYIINVSSYMYKFTSWNKYRLYKDFILKYYDEATDPNGHRNYKIVIEVERIDDEKVIEFAKDRMEYLNSVDIKSKNI